MSLLTAPQLRAGRSMLGWEQKQVAEAAEVAVNTIRRMEGMDGPLRAHLDTVRKIQAALEAGGIEFTSDGGVRPRPAQAEKNAASE